MSSAFAPIVVTPRGDVDETPVAPVYVYGRSGRCWTFANANIAKMYFIEKSHYCNIELMASLLTLYGNDFPARMNVAWHDEKPAVTYGDYQIIITDPVSGVQEKRQPTSATFVFRKANLTIKMTGKTEGDLKYYENYPRGLFNYLDTGDKHSQKIYETVSSLVRLYNFDKNNELFDYLMGDRVFQTSPRPPTVSTVGDVGTVPVVAPAVVDTGCFPFSLLRRGIQRIAPTADYELVFSPIHIHNE